MEELDKNLMRDIKTQFYVLRNGAIADRLRTAGSPYKIIFGLMLPQIEQIASRYEPSEKLADMLWANSSTRESRLMATMVCPEGGVSLDKARRWASECDTIELVDLLCFKLLRNLPEAELLVREFEGLGGVRGRYLALRLTMNLLVVGRLTDFDAAWRLSRTLVKDDDRAVRTVACQVADEIEWHREVSSENP